MARDVQRDIRRRGGADFAQGARDWRHPPRIFEAASLPELRQRTAQNFAILILWTADYAGTSISAVPNPGGLPWSAHDKTRFMEALRLPSSRSSPRGC